MPSVWGKPLPCQVDENDDVDEFRNIPDFVAIEEWS
jgi:hypothetical protein